MLAAVLAVVTVHGSVLAAAVLTAGDGSVLAVVLAVVTVHLCPYVLVALVLRTGTGRGLAVTCCCDLPSRSCCCCGLPMEACH